MIDRGRYSVLGVLVRAVDREAAVAEIIACARAKRALGVSALAVHGVMTGFMEPEQRYRLNRLELVVPDGQPVRWALNWLHGAGLPERVSGTDLMLIVCEAAAAEGLAIYLYGSTPTVLKQLTENLVRHIPALRIAGAECSRFRTLSAEEQAAMIERIRASGAAMVFVGLGCPRQETWVYENHAALSMPALAVGAAFDFHAGLLPRAPVWMGRLGLEWLFRLVMEPRRLWRRYLLLNPAYLWALLKQRYGLAVYPSETARIPNAPIRYG